MAGWTESQSSSFLHAFEIQQGDVVCLSGAGGKTSLLFHLAKQARKRGYRTLVTTTTKILVPQENQYDQIDLSGQLFENYTNINQGIYIGGRKALEDGKVTGCPSPLLQKARERFDLLLIEADGAACKPLKGWRENEPVIPAFTTKTIGIVDITTIDQPANEHIIHRLPLFLTLTGAIKNERITVCHLQKLITGEKGLFMNSCGKEIVFFNKMESDIDFTRAEELSGTLSHMQCIGGSVHRNKVYKNER